MTLEYLKHIMHGYLNHSWKTFQPPTPSIVRVRIVILFTHINSFLLHIIYIYVGLYKNDIIATSTTQWSPYLGPDPAFNTLAFIWNEVIIADLNFTIQANDVVISENGQLEWNAWVWVRDSTRIGKGGRGGVCERGIKGINGRAMGRIDDGIKGVAGRFGIGPIVRRSFYSLLWMLWIRIY